MGTGMAAMLIAAALVGGLIAGRWWGRVQMIAWLAVLLVHRPDDTARLLARMYQTAYAKRLLRRGAL